MRRLVTLLFFIAVGSISYAQLNMSFKSKYTFPAGVELANLWGYSAGGREYALVGTSVGMSIIDVTDPVNPILKQNIPGPQSIWREVRTHQNYAYVTTEGGGGLVIVNLSNLPNTVTYKTWSGNGAIQGQLSTIHALHIDNGYIYLYGSNLANGGAIIANLNDPWNPNYVGQYNTNYIHDGIVRNDTLWGSHVYAGYFSAINVANKSNPVLVETQNTPNNFTHNTWLSDNSKTLFTTDEVDNSFLTSYDVSDVSNIKELGRVQSNPGSNSMVHNTYVLNDFAVTSWYRDGVAVVDGNRPENMVIVGNYDTSPSLSGGGFNGCWGVYPYLPSGNILASDIELGLYVLGVNYVRACYLEGVVTDSLCGIPLSNVTIQIIGTSASAKTNFLGNYKTGIPTPGLYNISISSPGYTSKTINGVSLSAGVVTELDLKLYSSTTVNFNGNVSNVLTSGGINNSFVFVENSSNSYNFLTDVNGDFSKCNVLPGTYEVTSGKWNYITTCSSQAISTMNNTINFQLEKGIYDDFTFNFGWTESGDAGAGKWARGKPVGTFLNSTPSNPGSDVTTDCSDRAYVTGNGGGAVGSDDIDDGRTVLTSPIFDLTNYVNPELSYYRWFFNGGGSGGPNDSLIVRIHNGQTTVVLEVVTSASANNSSWIKKTYNVKSFITLTSTMTISFDAVDASPGHIVEAGLDKFEVTGDLITDNKKIATPQASGLTLFPNPFTDVTYAVYKLQEDLQPGARFVVSDITGRIVFEKAIVSKEGTSALNFCPAAGFYFVKIINGSENNSIIKLIKN